jgi:DNA repair photolyase
VLPKLPVHRIPDNVRIVFGSFGNHDFVDGTSHGALARGRGSALLNPGNRFEPIRLHILGEYLDEQAFEHPSGVQVKTQVLHDRSRTIINAVDSPDLGMKWTINPYRGCEHGCIYCYARPGHEYLGMSCGLDFETKIMAKMDAPELLKREFASTKWLGEPIMMSGVTDCYQPIEEKLRITRRCMEIIAECRQPVTIVTKNRLVLRDLDLLRELAAHHAVGAAVSVTTLDRELAMKMEPRASAPADRLRTIRELSQAGIPVTVMVAPVVPGLTDREMPAILEAAAAAGATGAGWVLLRLPHQIKALFLDWLARHYTDRAAKVEHLIREARGGKLYDATPFKRRRGEGPHAELIAHVFRTYTRRLGFNKEPRPLSSAAFHRPSRDGQLSLFD